MQDMNEILNPENSDPEEQGCLTELMYDLIDEMSLGMSFEVHRAAKIGTLFLDETDIESQKQYELVNERGLDIFGQLPNKKQYECVCPSCGRNMAASRFAPHLEKCMGMGRNSSRIASRRIANATQKKDSGDESDENVNKDDDWAYDRKVKKVKRENKANNNYTKKGKSSKVKNGDSHSLGGSDTLSIYESMTLEEKKALLMSTCGVISEHTKKMCTKSLRCPQHTEQQRRAVRAYLLRQPSVYNIDADISSTEEEYNVVWSDSESDSHETVSSVLASVPRKFVSFQEVFSHHLNIAQVSLDPDEHVDIDTYNEEDGQSLVQTLQWEAVSNPSPADSNSTTGSTSKKRKHGKTTKKKNSKSRSDTPVKNTRSETPVKNSRSDTPSKLTRSDTPSKLSRSDTPSKLSRSDTPNKLSRSNTPTSSQDL